MQSPHTYTTVLIPLHTSSSNTCDGGSERTRSWETLLNLPEEQLRSLTLQRFSNPASVHSRLGWCWQRRKKTPDDRQNPAGSAAVPETRHQEPQSRVHRSILHTPALLPVSFHGAPSPQVTWHMAWAGSRTSTTEEQLQVQQLGFPTTPFSLGSLHLTISDTSDSFRNAVCHPYRFAQFQVSVAYFEGCHI